MGKKATLRKPVKPIIPEPEIIGTFVLKQGATIKECIALIATKGGDPEKSTISSYERIIVTVRDSTDSTKHLKALKGYKEKLSEYRVKLDEWEIQQAHARKAAALKELEDVNAILLRGSSSGICSEE